MGEYYAPCILRSHKKTAPNRNKVIGWIYCHEFNNGLKQMEFGYLGNKVMNTLEALINKECGKYAGYPIVIAGDYDDVEPYKYNGEKINLYDLSEKVGTKFSPKWLKDNNIKVDSYPKHCRYIINETKRVFIDTKRIKADDYGWKIHPIAILCAGDKPKGGGCYYGKNQRMFGSWARNIVVVSNEKPDKDKYKEVFYTFKEDL